MQRATFLRTLIAGATLLLGGALQAQAQTDVQFYYPVAVGGPIAKTIDGFAADFMKANPSIKVTPIYAGTYQETIVKALTAHKSGTPPVTSVLLSTDMFTLIDEDAIVPFDNFVKTAEDKAWLQRLLQGLHAQQPERRQDLGHPVPALHRGDVLEQGAVQGSRARPQQAAHAPGPS